MSPDRAETLALAVLAWLAADEELLPVFLGASGLSPADLATRAGDSELLASVLEFVTMNDVWVLACAGATGVKPEEPFQALNVLSGAARMHWT